MEKVRQHSHNYFLAALIVAIMGLFLIADPAGAAVAVGEAAPDFSGITTEGKTVKLSDYKGKIVVLEWTNPGCPFVMKHYKSGNMQKLQKEETAKGVIWLSINSSAEGKEGYITQETAKDTLTDWRKGSPTAYILDHKGEIGHLYGASATPHMFVIAADGKLAYMGAIDDKPTFELEDTKAARNYVKEAIGLLMAGKSVEVAATQPYGCSVKY